MANEQSMGGSKVTTWLTLILGVWLILAPFILDLSSIAGDYWNDIVFGVLVVILSIVGLSYVQETWSHWLNALIGLWTLITPFLFGFAENRGVMWNDIIVGLLIGMFAIWSASSSPVREQVR